MTGTTSPSLLLFTDLDGTLLDHSSYSWAAAQPALDCARERRIPVVFSTSKTLAECLVLQRAMELNDPIIFENGAGVALPISTFPALGQRERVDSYWIRPFAVSYSEVRTRLQTLRQRRGYRFKGFGDMALDEVAALTGLNAAAAADAHQRNYGEPIVWQDSEARLASFRQELAAGGLSLTRGGRFLHVWGQSDKGEAMKWLVQQYPQPTPRTVALGDSENDLPMLQRADVAVVVRSPAHPPPSVPREPSQTECIVTSDPGPVGWNKVVQRIIGESVHG